MAGVLPGLGPVAGVALVLPLAFSLDPTAGLIMMAGIFYGAMYGGSTTAILLNIPGESASVVTAIDGYQLARKGRAGATLTIVAVGSFVGGSWPWSASCCSPHCWPKSRSCSVLTRFLHANRYPLRSKTL